MPEFSFRPITHDDLPMLAEWLRDLLLQETTTLAIHPDPENHRAIAAYQKAGFAGDTIRNDSEDHPCRIMTRLR